MARLNKLRTKFASFFKRGRTHESHPSSSAVTRVFSSEELKTATHNFRKQIGDGGYGRVYLGKLRDGQMVAVKILKERNQKSLEQFINEVNLLSRLRHPNLVTLYGFASTDTELLLVYEFVPNGTLSDHLHNKVKRLSWNVRIQIAIETAEALVYLHSAETPIIHRDVKSDNILLDNAFHVKVADFGMCRALHSPRISTVTPGTMGYRDPEYKDVFMLTDKSDVYSFGVVLLELISKKKAVDVNRGLDRIYLDSLALNMIINKELEHLIDPELGYGIDCNVRRMIDDVAKLAHKCLQPKGSMRPAMANVLEALKGIQKDLQEMHDHNLPRSRL